MFEEAAQGIYRIVLPLPDNPLKSLNAYLIRGERRHLLVDTGFNRQECREALFPALEQLGARPGEFDVFVTHLHADHSGLAADLAAAPGTIAYASAWDGATINKLTDGPAYWMDLLNEMARHGCDPALLQDLQTSHPGVRYGPSGKTDFTVVGEGDVLRYGQNPLKVLSTPGHTPDHLVLYEAERGILFSGDLILGDITPNIPRWRTMRDSLGTYLESLGKVEKLSVSLTLPGHRSLVRDTKKRIGELRAHHARRLAEVRSVLRAGGEMTAAAVAREMTWSMRGISWKDFPSPQKWFAINEALAHLDHLRTLGEAVREEKKDLVLFSLQQG
ncbi:MAG: MBL fold metallo-hydrolase [Desulfovibrio sp.]|jgi:glyoxylase-like metal-dependent hydrolase (beta-lactamase superfamily II)|nr:MBL fold metallo-hydrolase [Desulfovibrio sp.]